MVASFDKVKSQEAWYRESLHTCASQNRDDLRIVKKVSVKIAHLMANLMKTNWAYQTSQSSPQMDLIFPPRLDSAVTMFCSTCSCFGQKRSRSLLNSLGRTQTPSKSLDVGCNARLGFWCSSFSAALCCLVVGVLISGVECFFADFCMVVIPA